MFGTSKPYSKFLKITPPKAAVDRHGVAIVSTVKNEGRYISDWVKFHLAVGVRHFHIYDDGSSDDTRDVLRALLTPDQLTLIPWIARMEDSALHKKLNGQVLAFAHAVLNFGSNYRWMAFIDVDEFLLPKTGKTVEQALVGAGGFPNISLPWHMFGRGGHKTRPVGSILRNFTIRSEDPLSKVKHASNFKCIVDPCEVTEVSVHRFETREFGEYTANDEGRQYTRRGRKSASFYSSRYLQLNHYYSKSDEELQEKLARGPASPGTAENYRSRVILAVENIEHKTVEDLAMIEFLDRNGIDIQ
ncbi:glycosyltransferase family 92 protein [Rhizobium sp. Rhizsp82]|uniref:glycosyltransferase family 92 protein n=1 Tax=Rhizobium sp. Rhizsp82 TaxID=3243057 RepID=UPI0039B41247